jgi:release factor glutamine methyltransferase
MRTVRIAVRDVEASLRRARVAEANARLEAWLLLGAATGRTRADLMATSHERLTPAIEARLAQLVDRRLAHEPIAYILGEREFWSLPFAVSPDVLIPRPESETLVEAALAALPDRSAPLQLLDLGTGSGCLLLALLSELPQAMGLGIDLSQAALAVAEAAAARLGLAQRARFQLGDWGRGLNAHFDLVVSNPPYIAEGEWHHLPLDVRGFEPALALAGGPDGLTAYRALAPDCARLVVPGGTVVLEIGQGQGDAVEALLTRRGLTVTGRRRDLAGIERCLIAGR